MNKEYRKTQVSPRLQLGPENPPYPLPLLAKAFAKIQ